MNYEDETNPFADSAVRRVTATPSKPISEYNPYANTTTPAQPASPPPQQPSAAAFLPSPQPSAYQPSAYTPVPTPEPVKQPAATRVDLTDHERRQAELEEREKRIAERERKLVNQECAGKHDNNFPPLPNFCPCGPCFYQDISVEIPTEFQRWVRFLYYIWLFYSFTLLLNLIAALSYFLTDADGAVTFGLSIVYFILFIPAAYVCWFRPIYRAFSGLSLMIKLFASGGKKIIVGLIMMIVTFSFAILAIADSLIMIEIHRLYRQSGASLEQAQKEFQTAFVNNPTVREAAREAATAGINQAIRGDGDQRPIY